MLFSRKGYRDHKESPYMGLRGGRDPIAGGLTGIDVGTTHVRARIKKDDSKSGWCKPKSGDPYACVQGGPCKFDVTLEVLNHLGKPLNIAVGGGSSTRIETTPSLPVLTRELAKNTGPAAEKALNEKYWKDAATVQFKGSVACGSKLEAELDSLPPGVIRLEGTADKLPIGECSGCKTENARVW